MKIVLLQDDFPPESRGGAGILVATLALALKRKGHLVSVIAATEQKEREGKGEWEGIQVYRIYSSYHERWRAYRSLYNPATVTPLDKLLRELKPDVIHAHNVHYHLSYYALILAKRYAKVVLLTAHDEMLFHYGKFYEYIGRGNYAVHWWQLVRRFTKRYNPLRNVLIRRSLKGIRIVTLSHIHQRVLAENGFASIVIYNGIDPTGWPAPLVAVNAFKKKYDLKDKKVILFAGRISELKGFGKARAMFEKVQEQERDACLVIAGKEGDPFLGVVYTNWLAPEEMKAAYGASDVVIFPSIYFDPFGLVNIEAMASKKPVVATSFGGAPEIVKDGETGYVVNPYDTELFARKVVELLEDPEQASRFGEAGRARVLAQFTADKMAENYLRVYSGRTP